MFDAGALDWNVFELADQLLSAYPDPVPFEDFGGYKILEPIGKGGMGEVFLAEDATGRRVALKFLRDAWTEPDLRERFRREVRTLAQLEHPFIARLYEAGVHPNGPPYFAMEFVEGKPLDEYCRERACSLTARLKLFHAVCEAVRYAHSRAVIHLDLKPSNILVTADGTPKLLDFGIAKHLENIEEPASQTQTQVRFTPAFAAPEQINRKPVGTFTDVYSLGVVLNLLLHGTGERMEASKPAWRDLELICETARKEDVEKRYRSVVELAQDVEHFLKGEPLVARKDAIVYRMGKFVRRHRQGVVAVVWVAAVVVGLVVFFTWRLAKERNAALAEAARTKRVEAFMLNLFEGGDDEVGPTEDMRVSTVLEHGVRDAAALNTDPAIQADLYRTLGQAYEIQGKYDAAEKLLTISLEKSRLAYGNDHPEVAKSLLNLGDLRNDQARLKEAEALLRSALAMDIRHLPPEQPDIPEIMTSLGLVLDRTGRYQEAIDVLAKAMSLQSASSGGNRVLLFTTSYLGTAHYHLGHYAIAQEYDQRLLDMDVKMRGPRHPDVASDLMNLGMIFTQTGHPAEAEQRYREALSIFQSWLGENNPTTADARSYVAKSLEEQGKYSEARALFNLSLASLRRTLGANPSPKIGYALAGLGTVNLAEGKYAEAEKDCDETLRIYRAVYGDRHPFTAVALSLLGQAYLGEKQYPRAERTFREALDRLSTKSGSDPMYKGIALIRLGRALVRQNRYQEADGPILEGYAILMKVTRPSVPSLQNAREDLAEINDALHRPAEAAKFRAELEANKTSTNPPMSRRTVP